MENVNEKAICGFLNINKPKGITSHDVVYYVRKMLGIKQVGHSGTLDPLAEGVLVIGVGKATRLFEYLKEQKEYIATLKFGYDSETLDTEGECIKIEDYFPEENDLKKVLEQFKGKTEQIPPKYSAIKVNGQKLCDMARKGKEPGELKPRPVIISNIELLDIDGCTAKIKVVCSKGTYVRSLVRDIAKILGTTAVMSGLIRTKSGNFVIENSIEIGDYVEKNDIENSIINPVEVLDYQICEIDEIDYKKVKNGAFIDNKDFSHNEIILLTYKNELVSVAQTAGNKIIQKKVLI